MHTFTNRIFRTGLLGAMLWLLPLAFLSCDRPDAEVDISLSSDYRGIAEAIRGGGQTLAETLSLIEAAVAEGFADQAAAQQLLQEAVAAMGGTAGQKLSLIEAAVKSQAAGLETKLGLIEAAAAGGFADAAAQRALIATAIASVAGEAGEQLAAVETAVQGQTASLAMKLGLIETAVKEGLADEKAGWELLQKALDALGEEAAGRLAAIADAMAGQAASLSAKLDLLTMAIEKGLADQQAQLAWVRQAVEALDGTVDEKLAAVDTAVQRQGLSLEAKLGLIEAAVVNGFADSDAAQQLLVKAIEGLGGTAETKLAAIEAAVQNQGATLSAKLGLIETAVAEGFESADKLEEKLIKDALDALSGTTAEKLGAIDTAMMRQTASLATKLGAIQQTYADSLANAGEALALIEKAVSVLDTVEARKVLQKLRSIESSSLNSIMAEALANIKSAIQGLHDYKEILSAIETAIEDLNVPITIEYEDFVTLDQTSGKPLLVIGDTTLRVPYLLSSDNYKVEATASDGIRVIVEPDPDDPLRGELVISAGWTTTESSEVEVTISNAFKSETQTLKIVRERLDPDPVNQDKNLKYDDSFNEANPLIFTYKTNTPGIVTIPDSVSSWVHLLYASSNADGQTRDTIKLAIDSNRGFKLRSAGFTVTNRVSTDILTFLINQDYNKTIIDFKDSGLKDYLVASGKDPVVDINRDKEIEMAEAVYVTSLNTLFDTGSSEGRSYTSFNEFQYFTGITILPDGSFNHWTGLEEITFPESLTSIESVNGDEAGILTDCPKLTTIQGKFSVDGRAVVYHKTLLAVATGDDTSYSIPEGVTTLGSRSVYGVKELGVPASVTKIMNSALADTSTVNQDTLYIYFKGVTPPTCEEHPLGDANWNPVKVLVPAVIKDGSVDVAATNTRIGQFKAAFRDNANDVKVDYYTDWPFDEGTPMAATIARKQAYACDARPNDSIPGVWIPNEHIAVLYEVGGVRKRADARITAVKANGEATIRFTVDKNAPDDIACTLVYPLSAAKEDNTSAKAYSEMTGPQDGTPDGCFDVHVGSATFHTTNSVQPGKVHLSSVHAIFKLSLESSIDADHPLTVKDDAGNVITTVKPTTGMNLAYVAMPVTPNTGKYFKFIAQTAEKKVISLSGNYVIEKGKAYLADVPLDPL